MLYFQLALALPTAVTPSRNKRAPVFVPRPPENEKNCVEKNVSTPGISIYFEAYLYSTGNYSTSSWQLPASSLLAPQRRPSTADEEEERDSPVEGQPEKVKKPKKVYCYISPKVGPRGFGYDAYSHS